MPFGDVLWANLPAPDGPDDHVQAGTRPAIALTDLMIQASDDDAMPNTRTIVLLSRNLSTLRFPGTVRVDPTPTNGLTESGVILGFGITTVRADRIGGVRGRLDDDKIAELKVALRRYLQLD